MKNPAEAGFQARSEGVPQVMDRSGLVACRERPGGLRLVLVDQAAGGKAVQQRLGDGEGGLGAGGVVGVKGLEHLLDGGAQLRALGDVAFVAHDGLLGALLGGLLATGEDPGKSVGGAMKTARWQACPRTKEYGRLEIMGDSMAWVNMSVFRGRMGMAQA